MPVPIPGREYGVFIGPELLPRIGALVADVVRPGRVCVVTDSNVGPLYATATEFALRESGFSPTVVTVPAGEASKSLEQAARLFDALAAIALDRGGTLIALGGGVVGDLAGFVAATWLRGVAFVPCATTSEAAIDASVGGKTAVNLAAGKNLVGAFHQPKRVLIDVRTLRTLPPRDFRAGLAESVKHGLIADAEFLAWHEAHVGDILAADDAVLTELFRRNCTIKARVVLDDERETGGRDGIGRAALNFGHTIGHALESHFNFELRHGECVGLGMLAALRIGAARRIGSSELVARIERILTALGLPTRLPCRVAAATLTDRLLLDKKVLGGRVRFVLLSEPGRLHWADDVGPAEIVAVLADLQP